MTRRRAKSRGFAIVSAIFLLVVLAALGMYMVSVSGVQQSIVTQSLLAARVYYGARAGLDWAIHRAVNDPASMCALDPAATSTSFPFGAADGALTGVNVSVTCTYTSHNEGGNQTIYNRDFNVYFVTSTATHGSAGTPDYAERRLETTVSNRYR